MFFFKYSLSSCQSRYRNPERRSTDVVHSNRVAEFHAFGISAVFAANSNLQFRARLASALNSPPHKHSHAFYIERLEWIGRKDAGFLLVHIVWQEAAGIIAREPHGCLRKIVCSEGKKLRDFRDLFGEKSGARKFDHRSDKIRQFHTGLLDQSVRHAARGLLEDPEFFAVQRERMHDLR